MKIAKGETRPSRVNYDEPQIAAPDDAKPPAGLDGAGLVEWKRLVRELMNSGVLTVADMASFEDYCRALTDLREAEAAVQEIREVDTTGMGTDEKLWVGRLLADAKAQVLKLREQVNRLRAPLGLTPASRSQVKSKKPESAAEKTRERFFGLKGGRHA